MHVPKRGSQGGNEYSDVSSPGGSRRMSAPDGNGLDSCTFLLSDCQLSLSYLEAAKEVALGWTSLISVVIRNLLYH